MTDTPSKTASLAEDLTGASKFGSDEFFYDIFGINIKGLKSAWTLIRRPAEYFDAARLPDWGGEHWPSIRIWLGLTGILIALQFLWASESSEMTAMFQNLATAIGDGFSASAARDGIELDMSVLDKEVLGKEAFKRWILIYPFIFIAMMCVLAFIFRAWKPAANFVIRLRYIFGIIVPGTVFGLFMTLALVNATGQLYLMISMIMMPVTMVIYAVTAYRGPFHRYEMGERIGMSIVVAMLITFFLIVAHTIAMIIAAIPTWIEVIQTLMIQHDAARETQDAANAVSP